MLRVPKVEAAPDTLTSQQYGPKVNFAAFALRRDAFLQSGPILPAIESLSDWALFLQITPFGSFVYEHALISGYRVGHDGTKFRDRLGMWTRDQQRIFTEVMPLAAQSCGMKDVAWIDAASRYNFTRYLARASREFAPDAETRASIVPLFQAWADSLDSHTLLKAFAEGAITRTSIPLSRRAKTLLRPIFQRFHSRLRRG
jgi:hypothetical protein